jgi:hypothetical protein
MCSAGSPVFRPWAAPVYGWTARMRVEDLSPLCRMVYDLTEMLESYGRRAGPCAARYASQTVKTPAPLSASWRERRDRPLGYAALGALWRGPSRTGAHPEPKAVVDELLLGDG